MHTPYKAFMLLINIFIFSDWFILWLCWVVSVLCYHTSHRVSDLLYIRQKQRKNQILDQDLWRVVITKILTYTGHSFMSAQQDLEAKSFHLQPGKISPGEKKSCQDSSTPMIFNSSAASREAKRETSGRFPECAASAGGTLLQVTGASEPPISNTVVFLQTSLKPSRQPTGHTYWLGEEVLLKTTKELALEFWKCYKLDKKNPRSRRMS